MATARAFELRTIRRHLVNRWIAWIVFFLAAMAVRSGALIAIGFLVVAMFLETKWPLPGVKVFNWRVPSHLAIKAVVLAILFGFAQLIFPSLPSQWTYHFLQVVCTIVLGSALLLFIAGQVQLWRGQGLC